jgi:hypothetical protein
MKARGYRGNGKRFHHAVFHAGEVETTQESARKSLMPFLKSLKNCRKSASRVQNTTCSTWTTS